MSQVQISVFGCNDLRKLILSYVYPIKVKKGMCVFFNDIELSVEMVMKDHKKGMLINLVNQGFGKNGFPWKATHHFRGADELISAKVIRSKLLNLDPLF